MKRETLTPAEKAAQKPCAVNVKPAVVLGLGMFIVILTVGVWLGNYTYDHLAQSHRLENKHQQVAPQSEDTTQYGVIQTGETKQIKSQLDFDKEFQEKYNPTYEQAKAQLYALSQNRCQQPFKDF